MCELQRLVGFQYKIKRSVAFTKHSTLFYVGGQTGIFHNFKENRQKFFSLNEKNEFTAIALGAKNLLALASKGQAPKLMIYNLKSTETFTLPNPGIVNRTEYCYVSFSEDNEYVAAQGSSPSWPFFMWHLEKRTFLGLFQPFRLELGTKVLKFSFNPKDNTNIVLVGRYFLRIYQCKNGLRFKEFAFHEHERSEKTFHSLAWMQDTHNFIVGTSDGIILIFKQKQLIHQVILEKKLAEVPRIQMKIGIPDDRNITCLLSTKTGLICSYGGDSVLCLHWRVDKKDFNIIASVHIPRRVECDIEDSKIAHLALNSNEDTIAASTDDGQILIYSFVPTGLLERIGYEAKFDAILDQQHKTPIICADTAVTRPIHVTCSRFSLILWDYQNRKLVLWQKFKEDIRSVSIHPLGISIVVGFLEDCIMYNILYNKLEEIHHFKTKINSQIKFAEGGHVIALANINTVEIYSSLCFERYADFMLHEGQVICMLWRNMDNRLITLDESGKIYEWDIASEQRVWCFHADNVVFVTIAVSKDVICSATSDCKIWMFQNYEKISEIDVPNVVTYLLIRQHMLLSGTENGMVCGYKLPLNGDTLFQSCYHQGTIVHMTIKEEGNLLLVTGEDGCISMWKMTNQKGKSMPLFDEVLIEEKLYEFNINVILQLEEELQEKTSAAEVKKDLQLQEQETEKLELKTRFEDIQNQLKQTIIALTEEKYNLQIDMETTQLGKMAEICKEKDENYSDFQSKLKKEEDNFKALVEERANKIEAYEWQLFNLKEEIKASKERTEVIKNKNQRRLEELESILQKELGNRQKIIKLNEDFQKQFEEKAKVLSEQDSFKFAIDLVNAKRHNDNLTSEVERITAVLNYEKECNRTLDAEFGKKKQVYDGLKRIKDHIKTRISQMNKDIQRKESVLDDKVSMIKILEGDATEIEHLSSEADFKLQECKKLLEQKTEELSTLLAELEKMEIEQEQLSKKLKTKQREQYILDEKLKATEKSVADSNQKFLKARLQLEHYRKEFVDCTKDLDSPVALRWALLTLLDKRALRAQIKEEEEVFVGDTDPLMKFCRERDHYESLINTVLNRKQEIQASFRTTYVKLAKENSDWTAFSEALLSDVQQKKEKIQILEEIVKLPAKDFLKDPSETQKSFNSAYESLKEIEDQRHAEIKKRIDLIEIQTKELQRLHGLLVVEERGKIVRKIGH